MTSLLWSRDTLVEAATSIFTAVGLGERSAVTVAESLVVADARGIPSHGLMLVPMYVDRLRAGSVSTRDEADVVVDLGAIAVLDADNALGQLSGDQAMALAVDKAKRFGIGAVNVRRAFHFGGAFRYVEQAVAQNCIGVAMANTRPMMPATGGAKPVVGNNPVAIGVPRADGAPIVLDMALSEVALGKIRLAAAEGRRIPGTWATDAAGQPTTDAQDAIDGMLLPIGGPKGYGLALMVDVLTGVLGGGGFGAAVQGMYADVTRPNDCSHFFLAIDVASFAQTGDEFARRLESLANEVLDSPSVPTNDDRIYLPGERSKLRYDASLTDGISLAASTLTNLVKTAALVGADLAASLEAHA